MAQTFNNNSKIFINIEAPAEYVGFIIGKGGMNVKNITKQAKFGCHINHLNDKPGTFVISAYKKTAVLYAEIKIKELIAQASSMKKNSNKKPITYKKPINQSFVNKNHFNVLEDNKPNHDSDYNQSFALEFKHKDSIRDRKQQYWNNKQNISKDNDSYKEDGSFDSKTEHFPTLGLSSVSKTNEKSVWNLSTDKIKEAPTEKPKKVEKMEPQTKTNDIIKENYKSLERATFLAQPEYETKDSWDDDCSDWGDDDYEYNDNAFKNEVDNWANDKRTSVTWA